MKSIIVAFDFSKNAVHALDYALVYAKNLQADIYLVWIDNSKPTGSLIETIDEDLRIEKKNYLKKIIDDYTSRYPELSFHMVLGRGKIYQEIGKTARRLKAELIFTGTHGATGFEEYWIGSNAYRITTTAPCPVVTVNCNYEITGTISRILLPLDSSLETTEKLPFTSDLAEQFKATLFLLKVYNTPLKVIRSRIDHFAKEAIDFLNQRQVQFKVEEIESDNVVSGILNFTKDKKIDLIAIMTEQGNASANRFLGPYAQQVINNSPIPVMSLRSKDYHDLDETDEENEF
jgi:nucleotide-binding universal stress UspA family protein